MHSKSNFGKGVAACALLALAGAVTAAPVYWTDWTTATPGAPDAVVGTITGAGPGPVGVTYTGAYVFAVVDDSGSDYWTPTDAFVDGVFVDNRPPQKDIVGPEGGGATVHTLTFFQPVVNPVMAIVSLGEKRLTATYNFQESFDVVTEAPPGHGSLTELAGRVLQGEGGDGTILFPGTLSAIHWTIPVGEDWQGFTVGICGIGEGPGPVPIPAPGALLLGSFGAGLIGYLRRRALV